MEWLELGRAISAIMLTGALVFLFVAATEPPTLQTIVILTTLISILLGVATLAEYLGWARAQRRTVVHCPDCGQPLAPGEVHDHTAESDGREVNGDLADRVERILDSLYQDADDGEGDK